MALTVAAIALAVSLVVAVTSGYASLDAAARKFMGQFLGTWDAQVARPTDPPSADELKMLRALDPDRRFLG